MGSTIKSHQNGQPSVLFNLPWIPKQVLNRNGKKAQREKVIGTTTTKQNEGMKNLLKGGVVEREEYNKSTRTN